MRIAIAIMSVALAIGCSDPKTGTASSAADQLSPSARAGEVLTVAGTVTARQGDDKPRSLAVHDLVLAGDTIATSADSSVRVRLDHNNAILDLGANMERALKSSLVWRAKKIEDGTFDQKIRDQTSAAGRQSERQAADTAQTGMVLRAEENGKRDLEGADSDSPAMPRDYAIRKGDDKPEGSPPDPTTTTSSTTTTTTTTKRTPPKPGHKSPTPCDEVTCLLDETGRPCCKHFTRNKANAGGPSASLPEKLSRSDIQAGMAKIRSQLTQCQKTHTVSELVTFMTRIKISPTGRVSAVTLDQSEHPQLSKCVERAIRKARFPRSQKGQTIRYPIRVRP